MPSFSSSKTFLLAIASASAPSFARSAWLLVELGFAAHLRGQERTCQ
jgi:hypothetical protein